MRSGVTMNRTPPSNDDPAAYFTATRESILAFIQATTGPEGRSTEEGRLVAPPLFPVVASKVAVLSSVEGVVGSVPDLLGVVQVDHEMMIGSPVAAGDTLRSTAGLVALGRGRLGARYRLAVDTRHVDGRSACTFWATLLFVTDTSHIRDFARHLSASPPPVTSQSVQDRPGVRSFLTAISGEQAAGYAEVSGDSNPVHFDPTAAAAVGFPGVVAHGLCVLAAVVGRAVGAPFLDGSHLRRVHARFSGPALLGEPLKTTIWPAQPGSTSEFRFRTTSPSRIVLKGGRLSCGA